MTFFTFSHLKWVCIAVMALTFAFNGGVMAGHIQNGIDLGPNRSGTLYGVSNGFGNLSGFLVPEITKRILGDCDTDVTRWRWLFILAGAMYMANTLLFCVAASPKVQEFNSKSYVGVTSVKYLQQEWSKLTKFCRKDDNKEAIKSV